MAIPIHTPRVNNNDDSVRLTHLFVTPGAAIRVGDPIADVETDKATFTVEAEQAGFLLAFGATLGETIEVGSVLAWLGSTPEEPVPGADAGADAITAAGAQPTLKASWLLARNGLDASRIPATADRLRAADVERYLGTHPAQRFAPPAEAPAAPGHAVALSPEERGMLRTVEWQKREAVAGYVEIAFDEARWIAYAAEFQKSHGLLMSPQLALMAWRLAQYAAAHPEINSTVVGDKRFQYDGVALGFTVQAGRRLHVVVVRQAGTLTEFGFNQAMGELQRTALKGKLRVEEVSGATVGFTSMARWNVTRHVPILAPHTALMVAHAAAQGNIAYLGATYDHRILTGADAVRALHALAAPDANPA